MQIYSDIRFCPKITNGAFCCDLSPNLTSSPFVIFRHSNVGKSLLISRVHATSTGFCLLNEFIRENGRALIGSVGVLPQFTGNGRLA